MMENEGASVPIPSDDSFDETLDQTMEDNGKEQVLIYILNNKTFTAEDYWESCHAFS